MWFFWVMALLPIFIGAILLYFDKHITWQEWLGGSVAALAMAGIFQLIASHNMTDDIETWSGYGTQARQISRWQEYYEYAVYRTEYYEEEETYYTTDSKGRSHSHTRMVTKSRQVFDHWEPATRWHEASWTLYTTLGDFDISDSKYAYMTQKYNDNHPVPGHRSTWEHNSKMIGGDPNDYVADNKTGWIEPVIAQKHFENKVKAAPSLFSFAKVPTNIFVYPWPDVQDWNRSSRVMGTATRMIDTLKWDQMNAVLGAAKKINLIVVGFRTGTSEDMAKWQQAKWIGGKKNDLVICYAGGGPTNHAEWATCFGWTEKEIVKHDLEDIFLKNPINDDLISKISTEVSANYEKKNWHKFDYITIEPPTWSYIVYIFVLTFVQCGLYFWFHMNEFDNKNFNKQINYKNVEASLVDKLKLKWNALLGKNTPQPAVNNIEWPPRRDRIAPPADQFNEDRPIKMGKPLQPLSENSPHFRLCDDELAVRPVVAPAKRKLRKNRIRSVKRHRI